MVRRDEFLGMACSECGCRADDWCTCSASARTSSPMSSSVPAARHNASTRCAPGSPSVRAAQSTNFAVRSASVRGHAGEPGTRSTRSSWRPRAVSMATSRKPAMPEYTLSSAV